eukprot:scaffold252208_cov23-Tisochrysis_lutea.AAC.1
MLQWLRSVGHFNLHDAAIEAAIQGQVETVRWLHPFPPSTLPHVAAAAALHAVSPIMSLRSSGPEHAL